MMIWKKELKMKKREGKRVNKVEKEAYNSLKWKFTFKEKLKFHIRTYHWIAQLFSIYCIIMNRPIVFKIKLSLPLLDFDFRERVWIYKCSFIEKPFEVGIIPKKNQPLQSVVNDFDSFDSFNPDTICTCGFCGERFTMGEGHYCEGMGGLH